jgi:hypothetical protein
MANSMRFGSTKFRNRKGQPRLNVGKFWWFRTLPSILLIAPTLLLIGCAGLVSAGGTKSQPGQEAAIQVTPSSFNFGNLVVGKKISQTATIANTGSTTINVTAASVSSGQFSVSGITMPLSLPTGQSSTFQLWFDPSAAGSVTGTLTIQTENGIAPGQVVLAGVATVAPQQLSLSSPSLNLGSATVGTKTNGSVTLTNSGGANLIISLISVSGNPFGVSGITTPTTIGPGGSATINVSFTPATAGSDSGSIAITSNDPNSPTTTVALTGTGTSSAVAPTITTQPVNQTVTAGQTATFSVAAGGTAPLSYQWQKSGVNIAGATAASYATPVTTTADSGSTFDVVVSNTAGTVTSATATLTVNAAAVAPTITTSSLPNGQVGSAYSSSLAASGGTTPYRWSLSSGSLPAGLTLSSGGLISGTPTTAGTSSFTVKVTDSSSPSQTASRSFGITISQSSATPLTISTTSLSSGQVSLPYAANLAASGGTTPYSWSVLSGSLPPGLVLTAASGKISGTPTQNGSFPAQIQVTDSSSPNQTASQSFTIVVNSAASGTPVTSCGTLGNSGTTYVLQNNVTAPGTCITVTATNITLNLNSNTITYDTGASASVYGVNALNTSSAGFHLTNGIVAQSINCQVSVTTLPNTAGLCDFANPVQLANGEVDHLVVYDYGLDNQAITVGSGSVSATKVLVHDNTICPYHTLSSLSHDNNYGEILAQGAGTLDIYNNLIGIPASTTYPTGCPSTWTDPTGTALTHGYGFFGIQAQNFTPTGVGEFQYNVISMASATRDAYAIAAECNINGAGPQWDISYNTINQPSGRGILAAGWNTNTDPGCGSANIHDNTITVKEAANEGYSWGDPTAIQLRFGEHSSNVYNNTITVPGGTGQCPAQFYTDTGSDCAGIGIKIMSSPTGSNGTSGEPMANAVYNNTVTTTTNSNNLNYAVIGLYGDYTADAGSYFSGNTVTSNSAPLGTSLPDGCGNYWTFKNNTIIEQSGGLLFHTYEGVWYCNSGEDTTNVVMQDNIYQGGASLDDLGWSGASGNNYSYYARWTYTLTIEDSAGTPIPNVTVTAVATGGGSETVSGTTNSSGVVALVLTEHESSGTQPPSSIKNFTPHTVTLSGASCSTSYALNITATTSQTVVCQ